MAKTRAIRLSDKEEALISKFLMVNPLFDFSSLARTSILSFIENPQITIKPVKTSGLTKERVKHV
jgi:hypothetical protein